MMVSGFRWVGILSLLGLALAVPATVRAAAPEGVKSTTVTFRGGTGPAQGFLAIPKGEGPFPALVVVHEWWGLSDWVKENAERLAGQGYVALAVDLYHGKVTEDPNEAHELMRALDPGEALADLRGGAVYLRELAYVTREQKIGVIGWCMGGGFARLLAQESDLIGPTVICYGSVVTEEGQIARLLGKPVLGIFAGQDRGIPTDRVEAFGQSLRERSSAPVTIRIYKDAEHGFMRPGGPQYNFRAASEAWQEIDRFLAGNLKK